MLKFISVLDKRIFLSPTHKAAMNKNMLEMYLSLTG